MPCLCDVPAGLYGARAGSAHSGTIVRQRSREAARRDRAGEFHRRIQGRVESLGHRRFRWFFRRVQDQVISRAERGAESIDDLIEPGEFRQVFRRAAEPWMKHAALAGVVFERQWIEQATGRPLAQDAGKPPEIPDITIDLSDDMQRRIFAFLDARSDLAFRSVDQTIRSQLAAELFKAIRDGEGTRGIVARLRKKANALSKAGATRIARTESTAAMNSAQQFEREEIGIQHKEWISTIDRRTRSRAGGDAFDHLAPDGQTVRNTEPFIISGQKMMYPGDGSMGASGGNLINCRCASAAAWPDDPIGTPLVPPKPTQPAKPADPPKPSPVAPPSPPVAPVPPAPAPPVPPAPISPNLPAVPSNPPTSPPTPTPVPQPPPPTTPPGITFSGTPTDLTRRVWKEIGPGVRTEKKAMRVGRMIAADVDRATADLAKQYRAAKKAEATATRRVKREYDKFKQKGTEAAEQRWNAALWDLGEAGKAKRDAYAALESTRVSAVQERVRQVRDFGGVTHRMDDPDGLGTRVLTASEQYPMDWLQESDKQLLRVEARNERSFYRWTEDLMVLDPAEGVDIAVHELAHRMEHILPVIRQLEKAHMDRRVAEAGLTHMEVVSVDPKTKKPEYGWKAGFFDDYAGRMYSGSVAGYYEILTVGWQYLTTPYGGPDANGINIPAWEDKQTRDFVLGVISGA